MRTMDIESALRWAYRDELPKVGASPTIARGYAPSWNLGTYLAYGGVAIDFTNEYGLIPIEFTDDVPHPDAISLGKAVAELDSVQVTIPGYWDPFSDTWPSMGHLRASVVASVKAAIVGPNGVRTKPSSLVVKHAILGGEPTWQIDIPELKTVCASNGKPRWFVEREIIDARLKNKLVIEVDGWDEKAKRPLPGAYRKEYLEPSPVPTGVCRWEYQVWVQSLSKLSKVKLEEIELTDTCRDFQPWGTCCGKLNQIVFVA